MRSRAVSLPASCCFVDARRAAALERASVHLVEARERAGDGPGGRRAGENLSAAMSRALLPRPRRPRRKSSESLRIRARNDEVCRRECVQHPRQLFT